MHRQVYGNINKVKLGCDYFLPAFSAALVTLPLVAVAFSTLEH